MEVKKKAVAKVPEDVRNDWEEIRLCAELIRRGKARIVAQALPDGSTRRYTRTVG